MLIEQPIPAPIGGVTQLPPHLRGPASVSESINCFPSLTEGLGVRQGTLPITTVPVTLEPSTTFTTEWTPENGSRYFVTIGAQGITVTDVETGEKQLVELKQHWTDSGDAQFSLRYDEAARSFFGTKQKPNRFSSAIVGDTIYFAARNKSRLQWINASSVLPPIIETRSNAAKMQLRMNGMAPTIKLSVTINDIAQTFTYNGANQGIYGDPNLVVDSLANDMNANEKFVALYACSASGNVLTISRDPWAYPANTDPIRITVRYTDEGGDHDAIDSGLASIVSDFTDRTEDLPKDGITKGWVTRVAGVPGNDADDYWMTWDGNRWIESVKPDSYTEIDHYAMPWALKVTGVSDGALKFRFGPVKWDKRRAGDDTKNPIPFLGDIDTIFSVEQRLCLTSGPNIVMSESNKPTNIFRTSIQQLLASDPVAVRSAVGPASDYHTALQWDNDLYLWSPQAQIRVSGDPVITATTIAVDVESSFENDGIVPPVVIGSRIFYVRTVNGCTRVYEYWRPPGYQMPPTVNDITTTVPTYLKGRPVELVGDEALGFLGLRTDADTSRLYVCHFDRNGNGEIQPRWHTWQFEGCTLLGMRVVGGKLLLVCQRTGGFITIESIDVSNPHDFLDDIPRDLGVTIVEPSITIEGFYIRDDKGAANNGRFVIRNITMDYERTLKAEVYDDLGDRIIDAPDGITPKGKLRVPILRKDEGIALTAKWWGFITSLWMQGTIQNRSVRR